MKRGRGFSLTRLAGAMWPLQPVAGLRLLGRRSDTLATLSDAGRVTAGVRFGGAFEESPDTTGQDAGEIPDGESRWIVAQKGDRRGFGLGKGETVG
jgi:hypothetical protein